MEIHRDSFTVYDKTLNVLSVEYESGLYVWVGDDSKACRDLHCGFPVNRLKDEISVGSTLIGDLDAISSDLAKTFATRFNRAVFLSCNVEETDNTMLEVLQEELIKVLTRMYPQYVKV
ncbi:proteasome assembly chaperone 4, putative [Babesia ovata]|uniref:Proteasome assembly chaperone 4, putative n=1 Tax=Babesia ovata TaxID=189622 RepID=A0A2H6KGJ2_9APIC|nr:proteasome assembly chaperone 4, putative [Babesia ovata]GBE62106.1 proteasome assembly chaperone 4, putative [Babesia ovata]